VIGRGSVPGGRVLLGWVLGQKSEQFGAAAPLSASESRAFVAGLLAESFARTNHPGHDCNPDDLCWRQATRLFWGRWLVQTGRLGEWEQHDAL
jgi:hypothetical protein